MADSCLIITFQPVFPSSSVYTVPSTPGTPPFLVWSSGRSGIRYIIYDQANITRACTRQSQHSFPALYHPTPTRVFSINLPAQVYRLQTHPSIVLWGGNNENEGALTWFNEVSRLPPQLTMSTGYARLPGGSIAHVPSPLFRRARPTRTCTRRIT